MLCEYGWPATVPQLVLSPGSWQAAPHSMCVESTLPICHRGPVTGLTRHCAMCNLKGMHDYNGSGGTTQAWSWVKSYSVLV